MNDQTKTERMIYTILAALVVIVIIVAVSFNFFRLSKTVDDMTDINQTLANINVELGNLNDSIDDVAIVGEQISELIPTEEGVQIFAEIPEK